MQSTDRKPHTHPFAGGALILAFSELLALFLAFREKALVEREQIVPPEVSLRLPLIYFFAAVAAMGLLLFLLPRAVLKVAFKALFFLLFGWGAFVALGLSLPAEAAFGISIVAVSLWIWKPRVWLHDLLMATALSAVGAVFGLVIAPWGALLLMLAISVYDVVAVRSGYMMWMVMRLSMLDTLPAFFIPRTSSGWGQDLRKIKLDPEETERSFSLLGGGDIGFPLLLMVSVYFKYGVTASLVLAAFALAGLAAAYWVQVRFLKGRPTPAMPPITALSGLGLLVVHFGSQAL